MTKYILIAALALFGFFGTVSAQETYVGVQVTRVNPDVRQPNFTFDRQTDGVGGVVSLTSYETSNIGLTAEGSAVFNTGNQKSQLYTALGGLTFKSRRYESFQPYIKGLAGVGIARVGNVLGDAKTDAGAAFKAAIGADLGKGRVKYRLLEVGYLQSHLYGQRQDNLVVSTGIVF